MIHASALWSVPLLVLAGAFAWSLAEYAIHNWWGHLGRGRNDFSREHLRHHAEEGYFTPTRRKVLVAAPILTGLGAGLSVLAGPAVGLPLVGGFAFAYALYEIVHRRIHTHPPRGPYGRWVRRHHLSHHFSNPKKNHGVTSPLWDLVFGTYRRPGLVRIPARHAMVWLCDPAGGDVRAPFRADYQVLARRAAVEAQPPPDYAADLQAAHQGVPPSV